MEEKTISANVDIYSEYDKFRKEIFEMLIERKFKEALEKIKDSKHKFQPDINKLKAYIYASIGEYGLAKGAIEATKPGDREEFDMY